jgi:hypothetical protein
VTIEIKSHCCTNFEKRNYQPSRGKKHQYRYKCYPLILNKLCQIPPFKRSWLSVGKIRLKWYPLFCLIWSPNFLWNAPTSRSCTEWLSKVNFLLSKSYEMLELRFLYFKSLLPECNYNRILLVRTLNKRYKLIIFNKMQGIGA